MLDGPILFLSFALHDIFRPLLIDFASITSLLSPLLYTFSYIAISRIATGISEGRTKWDAVGGPAADFFLLGSFSHLLQWEIRKGNRWLTPMRVRSPPGICDRLCRNADEVLVNLNQFRLLRVVGKGAFGKVRIVEKKDTGLTFALKYIRKEEGGFFFDALSRF